GRTPECCNAKAGNLGNRCRQESFLNAPCLVQFSLVNTIRPALRSAKNRAHASKKFAYRERLGDVIIGAGLKTADAAALAVVRCEHQDRRRKRKAADLPTHVIT